MGAIFTLRFPDSSIVNPTRLITLDDICFDSPLGSQSATTSQNASGNALCNPCRRTHMQLAQQRRFRFV